MKHRRVVAVKRMPTYLPVGATILLHLLIREHTPPGWMVGAAWTIMALVWIVALYSVITQEHVDPFGPEKP